jgi:hypothetical protein
MSCNDLPGTGMDVDALRYSCSYFYPHAMMLMDYSSDRLDIVLHSSVVIVIGLQMWPMGGLCQVVEVEDVVLMPSYALID